MRAPLSCDVVPATSSASCLLCSGPDMHLIHHPHTLAMYDTMCFCVTIFQERNTLWEVCETPGSPSPTAARSQLLALCVFVPLCSRNATPCGRSAKLRAVVVGLIWAWSGPNP